jgi:phosphatidylglycerophosphatase A
MTNHASPQAPPLVRAFATFAYSGYFPFAPATFATAVFLAAVQLVPGGEWLVHPLVCLVTAILSVPASTAMEAIYGKDPHCVVIDEIVGIQVVLVAAEPTLAGLIAAFVLFRVFDVWKPFPIDRLQSLPGGWGIVADDALAGLYSRAALVLVSLVTPVLGRFFV